LLAALLAAAISSSTTKRLCLAFQSMLLVLVLGKTMACGPLPSLLVKVVVPALLLLLLLVLVLLVLVAGLVSLLLVMVVMVVLALLGLSGWVSSGAAEAGTDVGTPPEFEVPAVLLLLLLLTVASDDCWDELPA
jgi:hypothetical protein